MDKPQLFKWRHFTGEIILCGVTVVLHCRNVGLQVEVARVPSSHRVCQRPRDFSSYVRQRVGEPAQAGLAQPRISRTSPER
jgi:hypothetical protein